MADARFDAASLTRETVGLVRALLERDPNTSEHSNRTQSLALDLGMAVGLSEALLVRLRLAARLHDVGKIGIPDRILLKEGRLDADEMTLMRTHAQRGHDILAVVPDDDLADVAQAVLRHHERFDGTGYPGGLRGEEIPVLARIVAIADGYDAMATHRPYHRGKPHATIMRIMLDSDAGKYDPYLARRFAALIESHPRRSNA
jgi:HD-GYP domain-containing protein (c-di-GMP phosphodiesterase class II)